MDEHLQIKINELENRQQALEKRLLPYLQAASMSHVQGPAIIGDIIALKLLEKGAPIEKEIEKVEELKNDLINKAIESGDGKTIFS